MVQSLGHNCVITNPHYTDLIRDFRRERIQLQTGMHGHSSKGAAPASDSARRGDAGGTLLTTRPCRVEPRPATWIPRLGPYRPNIGVFRLEKGNRPVRKKKI